VIRLSIFVVPAGFGPVDESWADADPVMLRNAIANSIKTICTLVLFFIVLSFQSASSPSDHSTRIKPFHCLSGAPEQNITRTNRSFSRHELAGVCEKILIWGREVKAPVTQRITGAGKN
jgi:hypothetical protein